MQVLQVDVGWWGSPSIITPVEIHEGELEAWIEAERERVTPSVLRRKESAAREALVLGMFGGIRSDTRSPAEYLKEVEEYLARAARALPRRVHRTAVHQGFAAIDLAVENRSMHNFPAVEVRLTFPPIVTAYFNEEDAISDEDIPAPPRPYGTSLLTGITPLLRPSAVPSISSALKTQRLQSYIEQASRTIYFAPVHLRPGAREQLDTIHLILGRDGRQGAGRPVVRDLDRS